MAIIAIKKNLFLCYVSGKKGGSQRFSSGGTWAAAFPIGSTKDCNNVLPFMNFVVAIIKSL